MRRRGGGLLGFLALGALAACGGSGGGGGGGGGGPVGVFFVNAASGNDANPGTQASPFRTITRAMLAVAAGQTVQVAPGVYDAAHGETFPILLPAGASLIGDEPTQGNGAAPTRIEGGGLVPPPNIPPGSGELGAALVPGAGSLIAGFRLQYLEATLGYWAYAVALQHADVTLRNNHFEGSGNGAVYCFNGAGNHVLTGNRFEGNAVGLHVLGGGDGTRVESNVFTLNWVSGVVIMSSDRPDLGGGAQASAGLNVFACNTLRDIQVSLVAIELFAEFNLWEHAPPTQDTTGAPPAGVDIWNPDGSTIHVMHSFVALGICP